MLCMDMEYVLLGNNICGAMEKLILYFFGCATRDTFEFLRLFEDIRDSRFGHSSEKSMLASSTNETD